MIFSGRTVKGAGFFMSTPGGPLFSLCLLFHLATFCLAGCGEEADFVRENQPDTSMEIILTEDNHPEGWGLSACLLCHPVWLIHLTTEDPDVDLEEIREVVEEVGEASCMFCHGSNGT